MFDKSVEIGGMTSIYERDLYFLAWLSHKKRGHGEIRVIMNMTCIKMAQPSGFPEIGVMGHPLYIIYRSHDLYLIRKKINYQSYGGMINTKRRGYS